MFCITSHSFTIVLVDPAHPDQYKKLPKDFSLGLQFSPYIFNVFRALAPFGYIRLMGFLTGLPFPPTKLYPKVSEAIDFFIYTYLLLERSSRCYHCNV
jgi:hypothetical protein